MVKSADAVTLEPVSTVDGKAFYYADVTNVLGNGDTIADTWKAYNEANFRTNYNVANAVGYVDYVYQLKAVNGSGTASEIRLTDLTMYYNKAADSQKAYRVAVFAEDITDNAPAGTVGTLKAIYTVDGATNFTAGEAVDSTTTTGTVTYNGDATLAVAANKTVYYKIVIRIWLEGEDDTCCNTTFAKLQDGVWSMNTGWELSTSATKVTNISEVVGAKVDLTAAGVTVAAAATTTIDGVSLYKITGATVNGEAIYCDSASITKTSHIYILTSDLYVTDVTNMVTLPTT